MVEQHLKSAIAELAHSGISPDEITESTSIIDLGVDSMSIVTLIMSIESRLGITVDGSQLTPDMLENFGGLVAFFKAQVSAAQNELSKV